ncbi:MAG TPA: hypothetical protein VF284_01425 [Rhodanobacteraceae bacterium]
MADQAQPSHPRIALVFGDAASAGHLRDAIAGHVEIVYDTAASEFDAARLADSHATAALVNLDGAAWLDSIEAELNDAGVAVVFNDPEISRSLEGWAQARWLRHLTAKLSGSSDFDPPRPHADVASAEIVAEAPAGTLEAPVTDGAPTNVDRPLSSAEIESMTADFVEQAPHAGAAASHDAGGDDEANASPLDMDTEALSAMIDARLAEADQRTSADSTPAWTAGEAPAAVPIASIKTELPDVPAETIAAPVAAPIADDTGVVIPALDDWQLVDPEAPMAASPRQPVKAEPAISLDFAGIELVPMETSVADVVHGKPVEHHMYVDSRADDDKGNARPVAQATRGGHA